MNRRKRKSTPIIFGGTVSDEVLLMQRQIEEPEVEGQDFSWLTNQRATDAVIKPTGRRRKGNSSAFAPINHEHPTALIPTSNPQEPVENELRFDGGGFLRRRVGTNWQLVPPIASNAVPQPTGLGAAGSSLDYSRADHSHPTALIEQSNSQTPVQNELRFKTTNELVRWDGSSWVPIKIDAANVLNMPPSTITVRKNSGSNVGTRHRLNFIEGSNITLTISDDPTDDEIDITIQATGGGNPYNSTPQPTGLASAGTSTDYSRGDHSHATALIDQSNAQPPVERELRYNTSDALMMRVGTSWVPVKVDWTNVLNKPTIPSPSNATPQPTGLGKAGTSSDYSRADHSHQTVILPQSDDQPPVVNEIRFSDKDKLVRWNGTQWVELSVEDSPAPVQSTSSYGEVGTNNGEIWYRTTDRAFFFRIGGQRVYPTAALLTASETGVSTGAGNRILMLDSNTNNLLRVGGTVNQTVFAFPKLPIISGNMPTNTLDWGSRGAGTSGSGAQGALWVNASLGNLPMIYYGTTGSAERFFVGRIRFRSGTLGFSAYPATEPDGVVEVAEGGNLFVKGSGFTYLYAYSNTFDVVSQAHVHASSGITVVDNVVSTTDTPIDDLYHQTPYPYIYNRYIELGDTSSTAFFLLPLGFLVIPSPMLSASLRLRVEMPYLRISGSNPESWTITIILIAAEQNTDHYVYANTPSVSSSNILPCGLNLKRFTYLSGATSFGANVWVRFKNGASDATNVSVPAGSYFVILRVLRNRSSETAPRSTTRHRYISVMTNLPINRMILE